MSSSPPAAAAHRSRLVALFLVYLVLLAWVVLWKLEVPWVGEERVVKLVPFVATPDAGPSARLEVAVNLVLFVPFGVYLALLAPSWPRWRSAGVVAVASALLEAAQYVLAVGRSDVTDVVVNTAGGLAGLVVLGVARRLLRARTSGVLVVACALGTLVVLVGAGLYLASPLQYGPVRDVGPLARTGPAE